MEKEMKLLGAGYCWDDLSVGDRFRSAGRTLTEADLVTFVNFSWMTEELFTNIADRTGMAIQGRVVPGAMIYFCSEGLVLPIVHGTGLAFLNATLDAKGPVFVGDTIHVEVTVMEARKTSKDNRGLVRTSNKVINQNGEVVLTYDTTRLMKGRKG